MRKRTFLILTIGSALLAAIGAVGCSSQAPDPETHAAEIPSALTVRASRGSIAHTLSLAGQFQPYQVVEVHAKVSGYIRHIYVDIGDKVHRGEVLAVLEVPELSAQLQGTVSQVAYAKAQISRQQNEVLRAQSEHAALHSDYMRLKQAAAAQPGLIAQQELDDALSKDMAAEAEIDSAKDALAAAKQQYGVAGANNQRVSALEDYTRVTAPLDGVITWRYADTGALIQAGTSSDVQSLPVVRLAQSSLLRLRLPVPEDAVRFIHEGDLVRVDVNALNRGFTGKVVRFTRNVSLTTRTMETEVDVENKDLSIIPGMYANVILQLERRDNILTVPVTALWQQGNRQVVYSLDSQNRVRIRPVQIGIEGSLLAEITGGIQAGDRVIVGGQGKYHEGQRIAPVMEKVTTMDVTRQAGGMIDLNSGQDSGNGGVQ